MNSKSVICRMLPLYFLYCGKAIQISYWFRCECYSVEQYSIGLIEAVFGDCLAEH